MKRIDQVKKLVSIEKCEQFILDARNSADIVERAVKSSKPDDEKVLDIFDALVSLGLFDESELNNA